MLYDADDYFTEPTEFDEQIEEFKESLRNAVKDEIKERITSLESQLAELKKFRDEKNAFVREYEAKVRQAQNEARDAKIHAKVAEDKWKKARLHELLGEYLTVGWKVGDSWEMGEKCDKCDKDRRIHFLSPSGKEFSEECACAKRHYKYFPQEARLAEFYVRKKDFYAGKDADLLHRYYEVEAGRDEDYYRSSSTVYSSDFVFEKVNIYSGIFLKEEDCQKYCDWKNQKVKENEG